MPYDAIRIENDGDAFPATMLSDTEMTVFDRVYDALIARVVTSVEQSMSRPWRATNGPQGKSDFDVSDVSELPTVSSERRIKFAASRVAELMQQRKLHARWGVMIAKNVLGNNIFKGAHGGGSELVMRPIMPWDVLRQATATEIICTIWDNFKSATNNQTTSSQGAAWSGLGSPVSSVPNYASDYWMGYGSSTANNTAANMDKRACVVIFGFAELGLQRPVYAVQLKVNTTTYSPTILQYEVNLAPTDYRVPIVASRTFFITPRAQFQATVSASNAVSSLLIPIGFTIGEANYINLMGAPASTTVPQL